MSAHGTRATYQRYRCRCTPCRAAEAAYRQALRRLHASGKPPLGSTVPASATWHKIRLLRTEGFTYAEIARRLGLRWPVLHIAKGKAAATSAVRLGTALKISRLYRTVVLEGQDGPDAPF